jgi:hypothetical protein
MGYRILHWRDSSVSPGGLCLIGEYEMVEGIERFFGGLQGFGIIEIWRMK